MTTLMAFLKRNRFKSIISRILFLHVIALGIISVLMPLMLYWLLARETDRLHQITMRQLADTVGRHLAVRDGIWDLELPESLRALYSQDYGRYAYAVVDAEDRVLFSSLKSRKSIFPNNGSMAVPVFRRATHGDLELSGVSAPKDFDGQKIWVQAAENLLHRDVIIDDLVADFLKRVGWITLPILLILLAADIVIFRRALRPLVQASERAGSIGPSRTDIRLPVDGIPKEVLPLVRSINQALDRLEHGFNVQRDFIADAAHELRTPLAVLRTRIDTLTEQSSMQGIRQDIEVISRVVSQLLDIAELDTYVVAPSETADLDVISTEVVEFIAPLALTQGKDIALTSPGVPVWIQGDREMLYRAVRNLVENAIKHTPKGTMIEIIVDPSGEICVLDNGPGIRDSQREFMFRRFWRGDRRRPGAGLGLAIVQRIAQAHSGTVAVDNRPEGGSRFSLRLVLAEAPKGTVPGKPTDRARAPQPGSAASSLPESA